MARLPVVAELGDRAGLAARHEDGVETEAGSPGRRPGDRPLEHAGAAMLRAVGREQHELAHVTGTAVGRAVDGREQLLDVTARRPARRDDTRRTAERRHLDARVVREHPPAGRAVLPAEAHLDARVVDVGRPVLRRQRPGRERLELPAGEEGRELRDLRRVRGADRDG